MNRSLFLLPTLASVGFVLVTGDLAGCQRTRHASSVKRRPAEAAADAAPAPAPAVARTGGVCPPLPCGTGGSYRTKRFESFNKGNSSGDECDEAASRLVRDLWNKRAVARLIKLVRCPHTRYMAIAALGDLKDRSAVPVLMEVLQPLARDCRGNPHPYQLHVGCNWSSLGNVAHALGELKATEAVPILLGNLNIVAVIDALASIGDRRAIPPLRKLVGAARLKSGTAAPVTPRVGEDVVGAARIALAVLALKDPVPRLCKLLHDRSLSWDRRREVVRRLWERKDRRAIAHLVKTVQSDPEGAVVNATIEVLGHFKSRAAVIGLIQCFDAKFKDMNDWKRASKPEHFREHIAQSLRQITGQKYGPDKAAWTRWWKTEGVKRTDLR